jgi:hypothetical protein
MTKTIALLLDSYRELNSKKLFWVALALSAVVVILFGSLGLDGQTITFFGWHTPWHDPMLAFVSLATFYKQRFVTLGVQLWLSSLASILALVSTAGIFPDLIAGGSIDLYLCKPISRLGLFTVKFCGGLLFVTLQVSVFCIASFILLGVRGKTWEPGIFITIPLVVLMFSYLFAVCVLLGVLTRSTIASLMLTILFWGIIFIMQVSEQGFLMGETLNQRQAQRIDHQIAATEAEMRTLPGDAATHPTDQPVTAASAGSWFTRLFAKSTHSRAELQAQLDSLHEQRRRTPDGRFATAHEIAFAFYAVLPKTMGTINLVEQ